MSEDHENATGGHPDAQEIMSERRFGRSGFLARLGVGGLVAATTMFGRTAQAKAANCGCCNLANCPPNTSWEFCQANASYIWYCFEGVTKCACCETGGNVLSAYACV
jgi:hypothetical protein